MYKPVRRKLMKIGGSVGITFPKNYLDTTELKAGDEVGLVFDEILVIVKPTLPKEEKYGVR